MTHHTLLMLILGNIVLTFNRANDTTARCLDTVTVEPPNSASRLTPSPSTADYFQVSNMFFHGYICKPLPQFSNTAVFSPVARAAVLGGSTVYCKK